MNNNFKFYGSKTPIFWSKDSEDRPDENLFNSIDFQWELFDNYTPNYLDKWTATITLPTDTYTYFKLENLQNNTVTYWLIDKTQKILSAGVVYQLGMDIYISYIMQVLKMIPPTANVGIERTHLKLADYKKYLYPFIEDELISQGACGFGPVAVEGSATFSKTVFNQPGSTAYEGWSIQFNNIKNPGSLFHEYRFASSGDETITYPMNRAYVFYDLDVKPVNDRDAHFVRKRYYIFPIIEQEWNREMYMRTNSGVDTSKILGNTVANFQHLVRQTYANNKLIGIFNLPPYLNEPTYYVTVVQTGNDDNHYYYYGYAIEFDGTQVDRTINKFEFKRNSNSWYENNYPVVFPTKQIIYNNPQTSWNTTATSIHTINVYSFLQLNRNFYGNNISPTLWFDFTDKLLVNLQGRMVFSQGFRMYHNAFDNITSWGGELPSDKDSYAGYVNGIRESMNTAIKVSKDNMIMGVTKNYLKGVVSAGQTTAGVLDFLSGEGTGGMFKGINASIDSVFNIAGSIVNHENTKKMYEAQLTDAKNSIKPDIASTNDSDLSISQANKAFFEVPGGKFTQNLLFQRISKSMSNLNDNLVFLFGTEIKNYIPYQLIIDNANNNKMQCYYVSFMQDYASTQFFNFVRNKFPYLDLETVRFIVEGIVIGYRIWKIKPDLTSTYTMQIE